jgi:D-tyrosyl-tRNA(Tyr) deacylase
MRVVIQRVLNASVDINGKETRQIKEGLVVLLGIENADNEGDVEWLTGKIVNLRIFDDHEGVMNFSLKDMDGDILLISQFTLHASTKKGNRPSYIRASKPDKAIPLYKQFIEKLNQHLGKAVQTGEFGADMKVSLVNNGPVTIVIDTQQKE